MVRSIITFIGCCWLIAICGCSERNAQGIAFIFNKGFKGWVIMELTDSPESVAVGPPVASGFLIPNSGRMILPKNTLPIEFYARYYIRDSRGVMYEMNSQNDFGVHGQKDITIDANNGRKRYSIFFVGSVVAY